MKCFPQKLGKSLQHIRPIEFLTSRSLRSDLEDTFLVDSCGKPGMDATALIAVQRFGRINVETQRHASGNFVDVLAARASASGNREVEFMFGYFQTVENRDQSALLRTSLLNDK